MAKPKPVGPEDYALVRELHAQDLSRNEIARRIGRSGRTVSRIAAELELSFERGEQVKAATEARKIDARAKRAALANALLDDAERMRQQLWQPADYVDHGGKEYVRVDWTTPEPTFADKLKITQSLGIMVDRAVKLDEYDADPGIDAAKSMLGALAKGLGAAYDQLNQTDADGG
ncbi:helix-turn-helix domain-containing protein [Micromonospora zingiberis]|uniref:Helix-turn-helix domain-containing protein n=1 Tax=Micromonospora zingiberis TaxID=2053011 RepID=A0A4R0GJE7_9ACTN|nr:helix-turn-helix domain-containing protein [Micromonospora zingiberis]TCB97570.1 helix-turn-helix domain-containing protein [Micromonospora zingiberis]